MIALGPGIGTLSMGFGSLLISMMLWTNWNITIGYGGK
jgi:hypothetical protein